MEKYPEDNDHHRPGQEDVSYNQDEEVPLQQQQQQQQPVAATTTTTTSVYSNNNSNHGKRVHIPSQSMASEFDFEDDDYMTASQHSSGDGSNSKKGGGGIIGSLFSCGANDDKETKKQNKKMLLVILLAVVLAIIIGITVYFVTKSNEEDDFIQTFEMTAYDILDSTGLNIVNAHDVYKQFTLSIGSFIVGQNWPTATIPQFEKQCMELRSKTKSTHVLFAPLVREEERTRWEWYSDENQDWLQQSLDVISQSTPGITETLVASEIVPYIWRRDFANGTTAPIREDRIPTPYYAPIWQTSPPPIDGYGINLNSYDLSFFQPTFEQMLFTDQKQVLSEVVNLQQQSSSSSDVQPLQDPYSVLFTSIFSTIQTSGLTTDVGGFDQQPKLVGVMMSRMLWRHYLEDILPANNNNNNNGGIIVVFNLNSGCESNNGNNEDGDVISMSFVVNGPNATYLGPYDASIDDPNIANLDYLGITQVLNEDIIQTVTGGSGNSDSSSTTCPVSMSVYPTLEYYEENNNSNALLYCVLAVLIFVVAGGVFMIYDCSVRQVQQRKTEAKIRKTDAIVNSLFPENVRDRLLMDTVRDPPSALVMTPPPIKQPLPNSAIVGGSNYNNKDGDGGVLKNGGKATTGTAVPSSSKSGKESSSGGKYGGSSVVKNLTVDESGIFVTRPIADLFPSATVMFADIVGFTAWSSTREPFQVFTLLETIYNSFDKIATRRRVFKVETIGDCYVACCGLPEPRPDHAVVMGRFAYDCLKRMKSVLAKLEIVLGPDTGDLGMRFGLHSGPVTAGVLRGEKSRFQLFGDTVNTAARIESSGARNRIHISSETAEEIEKHGRPSWLIKRETLVEAKGKGQMQTFWLDFSGSAARRAAAKESDNQSVDRADDVVSVISASGTRASITTSARLYSRMEQIAKKVEDKKIQRLVGWNVDVLKKQLRLIVAMRDPERIPPSIATVYSGESDDDEEKKEKDENNLSESSLNGNDSIGQLSGGSSKTPKTQGSTEENSDSSMPNFEILELKKEDGKTVLDEVKEIITLPTAVAKTRTDPFNIEFTPQVISQLTDYITSIALMYNDNPFHCFEHASHVTMSVCKLLSRIVTPDSVDYETMEVTKKAEDDLHSYTYGITSDPIAQFACTLAALIHDTDHSGVPNVQLCKENAELAEYYKNKSVAEQNSIDLAWELLMEPQYSELRSCIYTTNDELTRFRQLLVNAVMATDIADKELGALRKKRWEKAFDTSSSSPDHPQDEQTIREDSNRKATIVIEHLIQASDVSHTMQHWHVFLKWNERLFQELYKGYLDGRSDTDPSIGWYKGEMGFFDFYLIPLAKKLQECQVFGAASDEYLNYAQANRKEWEAKGEGIVAKYLENYQKEFGDLGRVEEGSEGSEEE